MLILISKERVFYSSNSVWEGVEGEVQYGLMGKGQAFHSQSSG